MPFSKTKPAKSKRKQEELLTPVQFLKGVGPQRAEVLRKLGLRTAADLLFHFPHRYEDYSELLDIEQLAEDQHCSVLGTVEDRDETTTGGGKHIAYVLIAQEKDGHKSFLRGVWFNQQFMFKKFTIGQRVVFNGKPRNPGMRWEMVHPRVTFVNEDQPPTRGQILPVYRLTDGINQFRMRQLIGSVVELYKNHVDDVFPKTFLTEHDLCEIRQALQWIHQPLTQPQWEQARLGLVYQELFVLQVALAMRRYRVRDRGQAPELPIDERIKARILRRFPFELTPSQLAAVDEISHDLADRTPMNRLLHGDVGSGKTAVAFFAALLAVAHGKQAVIMAPTEILARQHARNLQEYLRSSRVRTELWIGSMSQSQRKTIASLIAEGKVDILIGTHAIAQSKLEFADLAVVIVDEQHKFGVKQRAALRQKSLDPHYLVMTATPIPRTIAMTAFGDLEVTTLDRDPNRGGEIHTYLGTDESREQWWEFYRKKLREGRQGYVIAPLVDAIEKSGYASAEELFESVVNGPLADFRVDVVHGRQTSEQKDAALLAFSRGHTQVLVATTVVEVGIDVPNATLMTIESAERFGISQMHQLRGRVGRGNLPGYVCVFANMENPDTEKRIKTFVECNDGFVLAEKDLELRGPGNLFSTQQHGMPPLRIADLVRDANLLERTRDDARALIEQDPELKGGEFERLRNMVIVRYGPSLGLSDVG